MAAVNETLARGLAGTLAKRLVSQGERFSKALDSALCKSAPGLSSFNQKRANRLLADLRKCGRKACVAYFIPNDARKTGCMFITPRGFDARVDFVIVTLEVDGRHGFEGPNVMVLFHATQHALERLYLRLRTLDHNRLSGESQRS